MTRPVVGPCTVAFLLLALLSACGGEVGVSRHRMGDTVVVENLAPLHTSPAELVPTQTWGSLEGSPESTFSEIYALTVGGAGDLFLYDDGGGIKRFDPSGGFVGYVARQGEGPREVRYVRALTVDPEGTVAALDFGNERVSLFGADGSVRTLPRPAGLRRYDEDALAFHHDGSLWIGVSPPFDDQGLIGYPRPAFARLIEASLVDTLWVPTKATKGCPHVADRRYSVGFWEDEREPWFPMAQWALGPDGSFAYGCPAEYQFDVVRPDGFVIRVSREWAGLEVAEDERAYFSQWTRLQSVPTQRPAYARLVLTGDGRIWVWPNSPADRSRPSESLVRQTGVTEMMSISETGAFDVFDESGRWLGSVPVPPDLHYSGYPTEPGIFIRGDTIWGIITGSLDEKYVTRFEVRWPG